MCWFLCSFLNWMCFSALCGYTDNISVRSFQYDGATNSQWEFIHTNTFEKNELFYKVKIYYCRFHIDQLCSSLFNILIMSLFFSLWQVFSYIPPYFMKFEMIWYCSCYDQDYLFLLIFLFSHDCSSVITQVFSHF